MDHSEVLLESLSIYTKITQRTITSHRIGWKFHKKKWKWKRCTEPTNITWFKRAREFPSRPITAHLYELSGRIPIGIGQAWNKSYPVISGFKVIVGFNIATQIVHKINIMMVQLQAKKLIQSADTTHHSEKVGGELIGTKTIKSKCIYN